MLLKIINESWWYRRRPRGKAQVPAAAVLPGFTYDFIYWKKPSYLVLVIHTRGVSGSPVCFSNSAFFDTEEVTLVTGLDIFPLSAKHSRLSYYRDNVP